MWANRVVYECEVENVEKSFLNVEEVAELLGFSPYTIRQFAREGKIPGRKIGREWRFSREALDGWFGATGSETEPEQKEV